MKITSTLPKFATALAGALLLSVSGCNKPPDTSGAPAPPISVGTVIDDTVITARVKAALVNDPSIKSLDFNVDTRKGEVQLSGFANNQEQIDLALKLAASVDGVRKVSNEMTIKK